MLLVHIKVSIGYKISCSCAVVTNDHCIHTLFVMLKKYKVPETHPILWQGIISFIDSIIFGFGTWGPYTIEVYGKKEAICT